MHTKALLLGSQHSLLYARIEDGNRCLLELPQWRFHLEEFIDFFQSTIFHLRYEEKGDNTHDKANGSIDKPNFATKPCRVAVKEVGQSERRDKGRRNGNATRNQARLLPNSS